MFKQGPVDFDWRGLAPYWALVSKDPSLRAPSRIPRVGDLIDLEVALEEDRERPIEVLLARDARIGRELAAAGLDDRGLVLAWVDRVRSSPESPGQAIEALLRLSSLLLVGAGLLSGALAVAGWLWTGARVPVNVVQLWPALVGLQLVLAVFWVLVRLAPGWLTRSVGDGLSTWLPTAFGALAVRFAPPGARDAWNRFRALDRVYAGLRFWRATQLSQAFAVAFNVGALAALFFIPTVDDPAFGWRSRLMDAGELQRVTTVIATPWAAVWPDALPTRDEILATADSSLESAVDAEAGAAGHSEVWAAWWPFLVASFVVYGLLPRLVLRGVAGLRMRRLLGGIDFDHEGCVRLRERLRRPVVDGRAAGEEVTGAHPGSLEPPLAPLELPDRVQVVRWAGVPGTAEQLGERLARVFGVMVDGAETAGGLDLDADAAALAALRDAAAVLVVVEAWEAPSADYLDFLRKLRGGLGERAPVIVLTCDVGVDGQPTDVDPRHLALWRRHLAALADPWLRVEALPADARPRGAS